MGVQDFPAAAAEKTLFIEDLFNQGRAVTKQQPQGFLPHLAYHKHNHSASIMLLHLPSPDYHPTGMLSQSQFTCNCSHSF